MDILAKSISIIFSVYSVMLLIRILASWVPDVFQYKIFQFLAFYTDPYLNLFRKMIPPMGMMDISPIFAFISLQILEAIVMALLGLS